MNNDQDIRLINENGAEKVYGEIPDLWHVAEAIREGRDFAMTTNKDQRTAMADAVHQVWMMAHDLKSVAEEQRGNGDNKAHLTEVRGLNQNKRDQLDAICSRDTAFPTFFDLVDAKGDYRPSIDLSITSMRLLADAYDNFQEDRGDDRRAYRYGGA